MNQLNVVGNVVEKPVMRYTANGVAQATFRLAVNRRFQSNGEWKSEATFFTCVVWAELAEAVNDNLDKGTRIIVSGRMTSRAFEDAKGDKKTMWEVAVDDIGLSIKPPKSGQRPTTPEEPF